MTSKDWEGNWPKQTISLKLENRRVQQYDNKKHHLEAEGPTSLDSESPVHSIIWF